MARRGDEEGGERRAEAETPAVTAAMMAGATMATAEAATGDGSGGETAAAAVLAAAANGHGTGGHGDEAAAGAARDGRWRRQRRRRRRWREWRQNDVEYGVVGVCVGLATPLESVYACARREGELMEGKAGV